jgi:hypothetical protein
MMTEIRWAREDIYATADAAREKGIEGTAHYLWDLAIEQGVDMDTWMFDRMVSAVEQVLLDEEYHDDL